jgi:hypothetical protein
MAKDTKKTTTTTSEPTNTITEPANLETNVSNTPDTISESAAIETPIAIDGSIVLVAAADLAAPLEKSWLDKLPKPVRIALEHSHPVEEGEMVAMVEQLSTDKREAFEEFVAKMNPLKDGIVVADARFKIPNIRIYHGVGDDVSRPKLAPVGSLYNSDGRIMAVWDPDQAELLKIKQTFTAAVVGLQETRSWWKPRDKNYILPPDVDPNSNAPICKSLDRKLGDRYASCGACPHRPYANGKYNNNGCTDEVQLYLVPADFSGIYQMTLKGASVKDAVQPFRRALQTMIKPWDRWFNFGLSEQKNAVGRWFSLTAAPVTGPAGLVNEEEQHVLSVISRQVINEVYRPALQALYERSTPAPIAQEASADMQALLLNAGGKAPDYSNNNL